jgi:hypothetical protein
MHHPLSEFRTLLEEKLIGWNLPAELAAQIEEHSTPVTFEKGAIILSWYDSLIEEAALNSTACSLSINCPESLETRVVSRDTLPSAVLLGL